MKEGINLAFKKEVNELASGKKYIMISLAIFFFVFLLSVMSLFYKQNLNNQIQTLTYQEENIKSQINSMADKKAKILVLQDRLLNIYKLLETRQDLNKIASDIFKEFKITDNSFFDEFSVESIAMDSKSCSLSISSHSLYNINELFKKISDSTRDKSYIKSVSLNSIGKQVNNSTGYRFILVISLK